MGSATKLNLLGKVQVDAIADFISSWPEVKKVEKQSSNFFTESVQPIAGLDWVKLVYGDSPNWTIENNHLYFEFESTAMDLMVFYDNINVYENLARYQQLAAEFPDSRLIEMVKAETTSLDLSCWGPSEEVMRRIAEHFAGGWLDANDCDAIPAIWVPSKSGMEPTFSPVKTLEEFLAEHKPVADKRYIKISPESFAKKIFNEELDKTVEFYEEYDDEKQETAQAWAVKKFEFAEAEYILAAYYGGGEVFFNAQISNMEEAEFIKSFATDFIKKDCGLDAIFVSVSYASQLANTH